MVFWTLQHNVYAVVSGQQYSEKVDMWAVGVLAYELLSGAPPFGAPTVGAIHANVVKKKIELPAAWPQVCRDFVGLCLNRNPKLRPGAETLLAHEFMTLS